MLAEPRPFLTSNNVLLLRIFSPAKLTQSGPNTLQKGNLSIMVTKWEYCSLQKVGKGGTGYFYPSLVFYTAEGEVREDLSGKNENEIVSKRIAKLGEEGWELITSGAFERENLMHNLYFKREIK